MPVCYCYCYTVLMLTSLLFLHTQIVSNKHSPELVLSYLSSWCRTGRKCNDRASAVFASRFNQQYHDSFHIISTSKIPLSLYSIVPFPRILLFTGINKLSSHILSVGECLSCVIGVFLYWYCCVVRFHLMNGHATYWN